MEGSGRGLKARLKLYLDEDVTPLLARALRQRGFDVTSAVELGHVGWSDEEQLEYAVSEGRAILTHNIRDFVRLHREWLSKGKEHFGIVVAPQFPLREFGAFLRRTLRFLNRWTSCSMRNNVIFLGRC